MVEDLRELVRYEARNGRAYITFCRDEKRNALTYEMFDRMMEHVERAERDDDVRVIIFRSEGRDFSTGHDLGQVGGAEYGFSKDPKARRPSQRARLHFDKRHVEQFRQLFYCVKQLVWRSFFKHITACTRMKCFEYLFVLLVNRTHHKQHLRHLRFKLPYYFNTTNAAQVNVHQYYLRVKTGKVNQCFLTIYARACQCIAIGHINYLLQRIADVVVILYYCY